MTLRPGNFLDGIIRFVLITEGEGPKVVSCYFNFV